MAQKIWSINLLNISYTFEKFGRSIKCKGKKDSSKIFGEGLRRRPHQESTREVQKKHREHVYMCLDIRYCTVHCLMAVQRLGVATEMALAMKFFCECASAKTTAPSQFVMPQVEAVLFSRGLAVRDDLTDLIVPLRIKHEKADA
jgi:hypothetical protein